MQLSAMDVIGLPRDPGNATGPQGPILPRQTRVCGVSTAPTQTALRHALGPCFGMGDSYGIAMFALCADCPMHSCSRLQPPVSSTVKL